MKRSIAMLLILLLVPFLAIAGNRPASVTVTLDDGTQVRYVPEATTQPSVPPAVPPATQPAPPVIAPPLTLPPLKQLVAPAVDRGDGVKMNAAHTTLTGAWVQGWRQNITAQHVRGRVSIEDVCSIDPYRADKSETFVGQCLFGDDVDELVVRSFYGHGAGWQPDKPVTDRNGFRHIIYDNYGVKSFLLEDAWLDEPACAGVQVRGAKSILRRCLITRAAIAVLAVMGDVYLEDSTIYDGHCYWQPPHVDKNDPKKNRPASFTGDVGLMTYTRVHAKNVWIVGHPAQGRAETLAPGLQTYHLGAVVGSSSYGGSAEWKPAKGPDGKPLKDLITAENCRIAGWPGATFAGDRPDDGSGWTIGGHAVDVWPALEVIRADMIGRRISIAEAVARGQAAVRTAAVTAQ
jgi:hypothetical protein